MAEFTSNEKKALIRIFKDLDSYYNANSLSKKLDISRIGMRKILKKLEKKEILFSKNIGRAIVYKINFSDYVQDVITFLLSDEANDFKRWKKEFEFLFKGDRVVLIYGSAIKNYSKARDIDLMVIGNKKTGEMESRLNNKQKILPKEIHIIEMSYNDFLRNIKHRQKSMMDVVQSAVVLYGQNKYVRLVENVKNNI